MPVGTDKTCVVAIVPPSERSYSQSVVAVAQNLALHLQMSFAALSCVQPTSLHGKTLTNFYKLEQDLAIYAIPLILLLGDPIERYCGALRHLRPVAVYVGIDESASNHTWCSELSIMAEQAMFVVEPSASQQLKSHPYQWPGVVQPVTSLVQYLKDNRGPIC